MKFRISEIDFEITFLFVAVLAFASVVDETENILLTLLASLLHECGHLTSMILVGNKPQKVVFELGGINIINQSKTCLSLNKEIIIALSGPFFNLIALSISCTIFNLVNDERFITFASVNLILMVFNLLPIKSLDGGRVLFYFFSKKYNVFLCRKVVLFFSIIFILITLIWGIYVFIYSGYNFSLIIIAIFLILSLISNKEC